MINYSKQNITRGDILAVVKNLKSKFITAGPNTELFEKITSIKSDHYRT